MKFIIGSTTFLVAVVATIVDAHRHHHHDDHHHNHHHDDFKSRHHHRHEHWMQEKVVGQLETMYVNDCNVNKEPHGFYGAFLEPCEFTFIQAPVVTMDHDDLCVHPYSKVVSTPVPLNWVLNLTEHYKNDDWDTSFDFDSMSSDDIPSAEDMMLWPDQCVGAAPRCYDINDEKIQPVLSKWFNGNIPIEATHVRVDCTVDSMAVSRTLYAMADGLQLALPKMILWVMTLLVILLSSMFLCCYGCIRVCCYNNNNNNNKAQPVAAATTNKRAYPYYAIARPLQRKNIDDDENKDHATVYIDMDTATTTDREHAKLLDAN